MCKDAQSGSLHATDGRTACEEDVREKKWWVVEHLMRRQPDEWQQLELGRFDTIKEAEDYNQHNSFAGAKGWRVVEVVAVERRTPVKEVCVGSPIMRTQPRGSEPGNNSTK